MAGRDRPAAHGCAGPAAVDPDYPPAMARTSGRWASPVSAYNRLPDPVRASLECLGIVAVVYTALGLFAAALWAILGALR